MPNQETTHDISRVSYHVRDVQTLGTTLTNAVVAAFPNKRKRSRYKDVHVLLLSWEDDNLGVIAEVLELQDVFENKYHFDTEEWKIPSDGSHNKLAFRIMQYIHAFEASETLLILYYGGHGSIDDKRQCVWHW